MPDAASRPNADPPASAMASMRSTVMAGSSSADSRVPGPPPRTSIAATAGSSNTIAVTPEPSRASSSWPIRTPATSVIRLRSGMLIGGARLLRGQNAGQVPFRRRNIRGVDEQRAMLGRELVGRPDQQRAALLARPRLLVAIVRRHVELVARADLAGQRHDSMGREHVDVVARRHRAPVAQP